MIKERLIRLGDLIYNERYIGYNKATLSTMNLERRIREVNDSFLLLIEGGCCEVPEIGAERMKCLGFMKNVGFRVI